MLKIDKSLKKITRIISFYRLFMLNLTFLALLRSLALAGKIFEILYRTRSVRLEKKLINDIKNFYINFL